jgi:hypothetical protein
LSDNPAAWTELIRGTTAVDEAKCLSLCAKRGPGCCYNGNDVGGCHFVANMPKVANLPEYSKKRNKAAMCGQVTSQGPWRPPTSYKCYHYTSADRSKLRRLGEQLVCEAAGNVFTRGFNAVYKGCGRCWCCQPQKAVADTSYSLSMAEETTQPHMVVQALALVGFLATVYGAARHYRK